MIIAVQGLNATMKFFKTIGIESKDLKAGTEKATKFLVPLAQSKTPVLTGKLRNSVKGDKSPNKVIIKSGNNTSVTYSNPIHWGWKKRNIKPNPFLFSLTEIYGDKVEEIYTKELQVLIDRSSRFTSYKDYLLYGSTN